MTYSVKEMVYTLQGEGAHAGRPAVFLRFAGCNLWSGREAHRSSAVCKFCDTEFVGTDGPGGGKFTTAEDLAAAAWRLWPASATGALKPYVVCTGGEPLLQLDAPAIRALKKAGFDVAVETNGTLGAPPHLDWICVSPKADSDLVQTTGNELKLVFPQTEPEAHPDRFTHLAFDEFYLQPLDGADYAENLGKTIEYCLRHPRWHLSLQTHKIIGIP